MDRIYLTIPYHEHDRTLVVQISKLDSIEVLAFTQPPVWILDHHSRPAVGIPGLKPIWTAIGWIVLRSPEERDVFPRLLGFCRRHVVRRHSPVKDRIGCIQLNFQSPVVYSNQP